MIRPVDVTPLNTTHYAYCECKHCKFNAKIYLQDRVINTDSDVDLQELLFEPCPKCGRILGTQDDVKNAIKSTVNEAITLCNKLEKETINKNLVNDYKSVLRLFVTNEKVEDLYKLEEIFARPSPEGAVTDFTTITKVNLNDKYISLDELLEDLRRLVAAYNEV